LSDFPFILSFLAPLFHHHHLYFPSHLPRCTPSHILSL
jgi:hypothetical protein